jgi:hypothetical protein
MKRPSKCQNCDYKYINFQNIYYVKSSHGSLKVLDQYLHNRCDLASLCSTVWISRTIKKYTKYASVN